MSKMLRAEVVWKQNREAKGVWAEWDVQSNQAHPCIPHGRYALPHRMFSNDQHKAATCCQPSVRSKTMPPSGRPQNLLFPLQTFLVLGENKEDLFKHLSLSFTTKWWRLPDAYLYMDTPMYVRQDLRPRERVWLSYTSRLKTSLGHACCSSKNAHHIVSHRTSRLNCLPCDVFLISKNGWIEMVSGIP